MVCDDTKVNDCSTGFTHAVVAGNRKVYGLFKVYSHGVVPET